MRALLPGFWLCQGASAAKKTAVGGMGSLAPEMECAVFSCFVLVALLLGLGWLWWKFLLADRKKAKVGEGCQLAENSPFAPSFFFPPGGQWWLIVGHFWDCSPAPFPAKLHPSLLAPIPYPARFHPSLHAPPL